MRPISNIILWLGYTFWLISCATLPTQEMSDARQAVKAAQEVQAMRYVPEPTHKAQESLRRAEALLEAGQFEKARQQALVAKQEAVKAYDMTVAIEQAKQTWQNVALIAYPLDVENLLKNAEKAAQEGDKESTLLFAEEAQQQGKKALNQAYLQRVETMLETVIQALSQLNAEQQALLDQIQQAYEAQQGKQAYQLIKPLYQQLQNNDFQP